MFEKLKSLRQAFARIDSRTIYFYSFVIGLVTGGIAILFHGLIHSVRGFLFDGIAHFPLDDVPVLSNIFNLQGERPVYILVILLPALGGLMVGLCSYYLDRNAAGTGVDQLLDSFHHHSGQMRKRTAFVKFLASSFTLSSGGSAGKEGPMALIGAGIGSLYGKFIKMGARARRTLLLAGSAGGLGAIFRAPLGGAITAVEVLYKEDFEADALLPCIISSVTAYTTYSMVLGFGHQLIFKADVFHSPLTLIFYIFLGLFCSGAGYVFVRLFRAMNTRVFSRLRLHPVFKPALGGLIVGCIGLLFPQSIGEGLGVIQGLLDGHLPDTWWIASLFLLTLALLKMLSSSLTLQSGGSGGVLIPSLFIGGTLGAFFGTICYHFFPQYVGSVAPFIIVGMAAFFASVTNASLGALVMVTELTGGYELLPPLMIVAVISLITSHKWSIYSNQVTNKFSSQAHLWDMNPINLQHVRVGDAFNHHYHRQAIIANNTTLSELEEVTKTTQQTDFIIEDESKTLLGLLSLRDLSKVDDDIKASKELLIAQDLIARKLYYVRESDSLYLALKLLVDSDFDKVPVVRSDDTEPHLLGYLRHQDILQYYYRMGLQRETEHVESAD